MLPWQGAQVPSLVREVLASRCSQKKQKHQTRKKIKNTGPWTSTIEGIAWDSGFQTSSLRSLNWLGAIGRDWCLSRPWHWYAWSADIMVALGALASLRPRSPPFCRRQYGRGWFYPCRTPALLTGWALWRGEGRGAAYPATHHSHWGRCSLGRIVNPKGRDAVTACIALSRLGKDLIVPINVNKAPSPPGPVLRLC